MTARKSYVLWLSRRSYQQQAEESERAVKHISAVSSVWHCQGITKPHSYSCVVWNFPPHVLLGCSVCLIVTRPANSMRIRHVSPSPLALILWHSATTPASLGWKSSMVVQIMGLKRRVGAKSCLEALWLSLALSLTHSDTHSLHPFTSCQAWTQETRWGMRISASPQDLAGRWRSQGLGLAVNERCGGV